MLRGHVRYLRDPIWYFDISDSDDIGVSYPIDSWIKSYLEDLVKYQITNIFYMENF